MLGGGLGCTTSWIASMALANSLSLAARCFLVTAVLCIPCTSAESGWLLRSSGTTHNLYSVTANHSTIYEAWVCGGNGTILHTTNGGQTWEMQNSGTTYTLRSIAFWEIAGGPVVAVGENGTILYTSNGGATWEPRTSGTTATLRSVSDFGAIIVGDSGIVLRSVDQGATWQREQAGVTAQLNAATGSFVTFAIGENGTIIRRLSQTGWQVINSQTTENLHGLPMFGSLDIVVGNNGLIWRSTNNGISWSGQNSGTRSRLNGVQYSVNNTSRAYCVGDSGVIVKTTDGGNIWRRQSTPTTHNLNGVFFYLDDTRGYVAGDSGTILWTQDGGGPVTGVPPDDASLPLIPTLHQNYPNPFNPSTNFTFSIANRQLTSLKVYDLLGRVVATLVEEDLSPGTYEVPWDAGNISSGVYLYTIQAGGFSQTRKLLLLR